MGIVRIFLEIHFLRAECEFVHPLTGTAENEVHHRAVLRFCQSFVGVFDSTPLQYVRHPFGNVAARVNGTYLASGRNLEVQVFACGVVIPLIHSVLFRPFTAVTQMFVALGCGDAFRHLHIKYLFLICHTLFVLFGQSVLSQLAACPDSLPTVDRLSGY